MNLINVTVKACQQKLRL